MTWVSLFKGFQHFHDLDRLHTVLVIGVRKRGFDETVLPECNSMMTLADPIRHLYVHVPFCSSKCTFCALYSTIHFDAPAKDYLAAVRVEMEQLAGHYDFKDPRTIYFGGGTPTQLSDDMYATLVAQVADAASPRAGVEWTSECAPATLSEQKLATMRTHGINRLSFGVQSFNDRVLKAINRRHCREDVLTTFARARAHGLDRVGLDLIACLPGVDTGRWAQDLDEAVALRPEHVSVYGLTPEPGTVLSRQLERGELKLWDEDTYLERLDHAEQVLALHGLQRYEISNYALAGRQCEHNMAYWRGSDFLGIGPGASSRVGRQRWTNTPDVKKYNAALLAGNVPPREEVSLSAEDDLSERCMFAIRTHEGLALPSDDGPFATLYSEWRVALKSFEDHGLVRREQDHWHLTPQGRHMADTVSGALVA